MPDARTQQRAAGNGRVPPHNLNAEQAVLGAMLTHLSAGKAAVASGLTPGDFYKPGHQHIYAAISAFAAIDYPPDATLIADDLRTDGLLDDAGGLEYMQDLVGVTPSISNVARYAKIVRDTATMRRLIALASDLAEIAYGEPDDIATAAGQIEAKLLDLLAGSEPAASDLHRYLISSAGLAGIPPPVPLLNGILDLDSIALLYGPPKEYKSFVALDWAACVASGTRWMDRGVTMSPVLYVAAEGVAGLWPRIESWVVERAAMTMSPPDNLKFLTKPVQFTSAREVDELAALCIGLNVKFIIIDTLARSSLGAEENSARDMGLLVEQADRLRRATGACVLIVHHSGKAVGAVERGSGALRGAVETVVSCSAAEGVIELTIEAQKNRVCGNPIKLTPKVVGNSVVLRPWFGVDGGADLSPNAVSALETLATICAGQEGNPATASVWFRASGLAERTFYRVKEQLVGGKFVHIIPSGKTLKFVPDTLKITAAVTATSQGDGELF